LWSVEVEGVAIVTKRVLPGSTVYADQAPHWDTLHARYATSGSTIPSPSPTTAPAPTKRSYSSPSAVCHFVEGCLSAVRVGLACASGGPFD